MLIHNYYYILQISYTKGEYLDSRCEGKCMEHLVTCSVIIQGIGRIHCLKTAAFDKVQVLLDTL